MLKEEIFLRTVPKGGNIQIRGNLENENLASYAHMLNDGYIPY